MCLSSAASSAVRFVVGGVCFFALLASHTAGAVQRLSRSIHLLEGCRLDLCRNLRKVWMPSVPRLACWIQRL